MQDKLEKSGSKNKHHAYGSVFNMRIESRAAIAQLGERQTEDLKVPGSIPGLGIFVLPLLQPPCGFEKIRLRLRSVCSTNAKEAWSAEKRPSESMQGLGGGRRC